jgi:hypothetical protein
MVAYSPQLLDADIEQQERVFGKRCLALAEGNGAPVTDIQSLAAPVEPVSHYRFPANSFLMLPLWFTHEVCWGSRFWF